MLVKLIIKNIWRNKFIGLISILSLSFFISSFIITNWLLENSLQIFSQLNFGNQKNKFIIQQGKTKIFNFLGNHPTLKDVYKQLSNDSNVKEIWGIYKVNIPVTMIINFLNFNFKTDINLFASDKGDLCFSGKYLAAGINPNILTLYNLEVAGNNYPTISKDLLSKIPINLILGENSFYKLDKTINEKIKIIEFDKNRPLLGITIGYKPAKEIINQLGGNLKLIKIVGFTKNQSYINKLENKYYNFKIITYNKITKQAKKREKIIKKVFTAIKSLIIFLGFVFIIFMISLIKEKNKYIIETLKNNQANKIQLVLYSYGEIIVYVILSLILSSLILLVINNKVYKIQNLLNQNGILVKISPVY